MANKTWTLRSGDDTAEISAFGAIALSWKVKRGDELVELLDGYASDEEREELHGYRNAVLAPWSNRKPTPSPTARPQSLHPTRPRPRRQPAPRPGQRRGPARRPRPGARD